MISDLHKAAHGAGVNVTYGEGLPGMGGLILPDIVNYQEGKIGEIKPLSVSGIAGGYIQLKAALKIANGLSVTYHGITVPLTAPIPHRGSSGPWVPEDWQPGVRVLFLGVVNPSICSWIALTLVNIDGLILYKAIKCPIPELATAAAYVVAEKLAGIASELVRDMRFGLDPALELLYEYRLEAAVTALALVGVVALKTAPVGAIETLRLRVMKAVSGFNTFGTFGLAAAFG
jgi:hypothetical protein